MRFYYLCLVGMYIGGAHMQLLASSFLFDKKAHVRCVYYDKNAPYSQLTGEAWVWARSSRGDYLSFTGEVEGSFFLMPSEMSKVSLQEMCKQSLPTNSRLLEMSIQYGRFGQSYTPLFKGEQAVVVFGASLSDPGNLQRWLRAMPRKPYWNGRFSNGPIWTDYLSRYTPLAITNLAYGGSKTSVDINHRQWFLPRMGIWLQNKWITGNVKELVGGYLARYVWTKKGIAETVFVLSGGANNYLHRVNVLRSQKQQLSKAQRQVFFRKEIVDSVQRDTQDTLDVIAQLQEAGAKKIVVTTLPDLSKTPYAREYGLQHALRLLSISHNELLKRALKERKKKQRSSLSSSETPSHLVLQNITAIFAQIQAEPHHFGLRNTLEPCHQGYYGLYQGTTCSKETQDTFLWFDFLHPTSRVHCLLALESLHEWQRLGFVSGAKKWPWTNRVKQCDQWLQEADR